MAYEYGKKWKPGVISVTIDDLNKLQEMADQYTDIMKEDKVVVTKQYVGEEPITEVVEPVKKKKDK